MFDIIDLWGELAEFVETNMYGSEKSNINKKAREAHYDIVFDSEDHNVFVLLNDQSIIEGFVEVCVNEPDFSFHLDRYGYIAYFYVRKDYRNPRIMTELYKMSEDWLISRGVKYICSDVDGGNYISLKYQEKFLGMKPFKIRLSKKVEDTNNQK